MSLNEKILTQFYPDDYPDLLPEKDLAGITVLKKLSPARYVIHVQEFDPNINVTEQIRLAKKIITKRCRALWLIREVGACIIFTCNKLPSVAKEDLVVDKTGFHAVIVQGVHLISESGKQVYNQSQWFDRTFGKSSDVVKALRDVAI